MDKGNTEYQKPTRDSGFGSQPTESYLEENKAKYYPASSEDELASLKTYDRDLTDKERQIGHEYLDALGILHCDNFIKRRVAKVPVEILEKDEFELSEEVKPTYLDHKLKIAMWKEFEDAKLEGREAKIRNIANGVCNAAAFRRRLSNQHRLAWFLTPLVKFKDSIDALIEHTMADLREIVKMPIINSKGNYSAALAAVKLKAIDKLHDRGYGQAVQRTETVKKNGYVDKDGRLLTLEDINKKIKLLENDGANLIDITPEEEPNGKKEED